MAGQSIIQFIGFDLSSDEDRLRDSYAAITSYELFTAAGQPVPGGVYDLRLGTTDHSFLCLTCVLGKKLCPGHRGHLVSRVAVPPAIGIAEIRRWLRVVCLKCGEVVVDREKYIHLPPGKRLAEAAMAVTEGKRCPRRGCGAVHPRIVKDDEDHFTFWAEPPAATEKKGARGAPRGAEKKGEKLYFDAIRAILERVSDSAVEALGRPAGQPRKLTQRIIGIAPNTIRPGVRSFGGAGSSYHDSTNLLQHLVKRNGQLPERLPEAMGPLGPGGPVDGETDRAVQNFQQIYYDFVMGSSSTSVTQGSSGRRGLVVGARPVHSILRNLPRKEGRIRANLLGKRVFYISRSTISGNMRYRLDEVGVPLDFARTLQVKETVQEYNRDWLMTFFLNGRRQYPGCTQLVRRATREVHDVAGLRDFRLEVGDVLYRDVVNGDVAYFNRQPTLERSSIGVHRVIVIQDPSVHTFQMNVGACEWYNADFDGDQMNLWVARSPGARAEAMIMSAVANWFISTKTSGPVNGEVQDSTVGCNELTRSGVEVDKYHAMGLFAAAGVEPPRFDARPAGELYTGREIVSLLFAATPVNYSRVPSSYSDVYAPYVRYHPDETLTVFEQGRLIKGVLDKRSIGAKASGGVFHLISREYGPQRALDMVYALQQVALQFLLFQGFTVGTADLLPGPEALEQIRALVSSVLLESRVITDRLLRGEIVPPIDSTVHEFYERSQIAALKVPESQILRWILDARVGIRPASNGFFRMIAVQSKGNNPNLIHVSGAIGQTTINGERIREQFAFRRTLPYYARFSIDPAAYGFVANSYMTGMRTGEFIFQDMNGRFDLINKALSTASTGYFMRKGIMNNQSSVVDNFRRVTKDTKIVQFLYGEDGLDSRELERVSFATVPLSDAALREASWLDLAAAGAAGPELKAAQAAVDQACDKIREDRDAFRRIFFRVEDANFGQTFSTELLMPVNVRRIVDGVFIAAAADGRTEPPPVTAAGLAARVERVWDLCVRLPYALINEIQERRRTPVPRHITAAASLLCILVRAELSPRVLARLTDEQLSFVIEAIRQRYSLSLIGYGTAVGVLASQCVSEPLTQYMLDSHHRSVAGGTNKSGLVRVSEIYGARPVSEEQSPAMLLPLRPEALGPAEGAFAVAQEIATSIEFVTLRRFTRAHDTLLEPYGALVYPPYAADRAWIAEFERHHPLVRPPGDLTNWCFRFALDKSALVLKAVELELIVRRLRARHPGLYVVHTPEAVPEVIIRVWHRASQFKRGGDDETRAAALLEEALDTPIRGIRGIMRASAERVSRHRAGPDGALVKEDRFMIATVGTNLYGALLHSAVDARRVISTSIGDTLKLFGIEAANAKIVSETRSFMEDNTPNLRHIYLYSDEMTRTGRVTSVERGGLGAREHNNVLLRMAYGDPIRVVTDATLAGARSRVYGIAAPQILGSIPQIGTLYNSVLMDEEFIRENVKSVDSVLDEL
jgi:DNA-directed RNA polymerase beta' subunit